MNAAIPNRPGTQPRLNLLVLRSSNAGRLADFYSLLGLCFDVHRHGTGPEHFCSQLGSGVFEIYPQDSNSSGTASVRLGFAVTDVDHAYAELIAVGGKNVQKPSPSPWGRRAVLQDFDGHKVELTEMEPETLPLRTFAEV